MGSQIKKHKRFLLFAYDTYYPNGGICDLIESFDTIDEAVEFKSKEYRDYYELFDCDERQEIELPE